MIPLRTYLLLTICYLMLSIPAAASIEEGQPGSDSNPHIIPDIDQSISIDGQLDENAWKTAWKHNLSYEVRPGENIEPPVRTELYLMYSRTHLYVAFKCYDPRPSDIRVQYADRDTAWNNDFAGIVIDTFNDERRAFEFLVNPYGVQMDMIFDGVNDNEDASWNAIWDSAAQVTDFGWQAELAIPFTQIRFQRTSGKQTWGLDAVRSYPRGDRYHIGLVPRDRNIDSYLTQLMKVRGFDGVERGKNLEITPTVTAFKTQEREDFPEGMLEDTESDSDAGISLRWGVTPNITLNGTINPDFSQIEADSVQLSINETFALFFPETRPFFLDQADYFDVPLLNLVHTRSIADPNFAAKVTGKQGRHTYGLFTAEDDFTSVILPGALGSDSGSFGFKSAATVARYRYDVGDSSVVGASLTNRQGSGYDNTVVSFDTRYRFTDQDTFRANISASQSTYNREMSDFFGLEEDEISDRAINLHYVHATRNWRFNVSYADFGADYRADLGFVPQVDYRKIIIGGDRHFWGDEDDFYNRLTITGDYDRTEDQDGKLIEEEYEAYFMGLLPRNTFFLVGGGVRDRVFNGVTFDNWWVQSNFNTDVTSFIQAGGFFRRGKFIDFAHTREADRWLADTWWNIRLGDHLYTTGRYNFSALDVEGGQRLFSTHVPEVRLIYQFNRRMFIRAIFQYVYITRDPDLYAFEVDEETKDLLTQLLFTYKINPQTVLYLGYSDNRFGNQDFGLTQRDRTVFMKIGYAWLQ